MVWVQEKEEFEIDLGNSDAFTWMQVWLQQNSWSESAVEATTNRNKGQIRQRGLDLMES